MSLLLRRSYAPRKTHAFWLARYFCGRRTTARPRHRLTLERCESRIAPATATLSNGVLTIDFTATGTTAESVTLTNDGTNIALTGDVSGDTFVPQGSVTKLAAQDSGGGTAQGLYFDGDAQFNFSEMICTGVSSVTISTPIKVTGSGVLFVEVTRSIQVFSHLQTTDGNLTLVANQQDPATLGTFHGIEVSAATIGSSTGAITLKGRCGGQPGSSIGVYLHDGAKVGTGTTGHVLVYGTGAPTGTQRNNMGVRIVASTVESSGGDVEVTGVSTGIFWGGNRGVSVDSGQIMAGGMGSLAVHGTGGQSSAGSNHGVYQSDGTIGSSGGAVIVVGQGGGLSGSGSSANAGVSATNISAGGAGSVTVQGIGGPGSDWNFGAAVTVTSSSGDITIIGKGGGTGSGKNNVGVSGSSSTGGAGKIVILGTGGPSTGSGNYGVSVGSQIKTAGGSISITAINGNQASDAISLSGTITGGSGLVLIEADSLAFASASPSITGSTVTFLPHTPGTRINLGGADVKSGSPLTLGLASSELAGVHGDLQIGNSASGPIVVSGEISRAKKVNLTTGGDISFRANVKLSNGALTLNCAGPITQTAGNIQCGTLTLNAPNQIATFNMVGNKATQLVIPVTVTAIVNGSFDSTGFVQVDGMLTGAGSVGITTVSSTGRIKPGSGGPGRLTTGSVVLNSGSVFDVQLNGASHSRLAVNGTVNLGGATLQATASGPSLGLAYRIVDNLGGGNVTGTFAGYAQGVPLVIGSSHLVLSYKGGTGNDVTLTPPAIVSSIVFGDGTSQRSLVKQLIVNFTQLVNFSPDAFKLTRNGGGDVGLTLSPTAGPASLVTLKFSGSLTEFNSLVDGFYNLTIDASKITTSAGSLDGDANGNYGGNYAVTGSTVNKFFRFFGDSDGSGSVDFLTDFIAFRNAFANGGPSATFDFDGNGTVDFLFDFIRFRNHYNLSP